MKPESKLNLLFLLGLMALAIFSSVALFRLREAVAGGSQVLQGTAQVAKLEAACTVLGQIDQMESARRVLADLRQSEPLFEADRELHRLWKDVVDAPDVASARTAACSLERRAHASLTQRLSRESSALQLLEQTISFAFAALSLFVAVMVLHSYRQARTTRKAEQARIESEQRWHLALAANNDGLWDWSPPTGVAYYSPQFTRMLGHPDGLPSRWEEWLNRVHPDDLPGFLSELEQHLSRKSQSLSTEIRMEKRDGGYVWILLRAQATWDERNRAVRMVGCVTDISQRKAVEQDLHYRATHDPLTGLLNRSGFDAKFREAVEQCQTSGDSLSLCLCDLDNFKELNDSLGHQAGDEALRRFAQLLRLRFRSGDWGARLGGDEFAVLMPGTSVVQAIAAVERFREAIVRTRPTASFGVTAWDPANPHRDLFATADEALYTAKREGRNRVRALGVTDLNPGSRPLPRPDSASPAA